jgi:membrane protein YqaA with SNARE-associated domain
LSHLFQVLLHFFFQSGYLGPFLLGILDSSFLFVPVGNDILVVILVARHHQAYLIYVLSAVIGSTTGAFLLDLVARKLGEAGVQKVVGEKQFGRLKKKIGQHGGKFVALGSLAPPPFPFTMAVATTSALGYSRVRLLLTVAISRTIRFLILGALAMQFGPRIIRVVQSPAFKWTMICFAALCVIGSAISIVGWFRKGRETRSGQPAYSRAQ